MPAAALEAEVDVYIAELAHERDERGRRLVVRNGHYQLRRVTTAAGVVEVRAPRVNDKRVDEASGNASGSPRRSCRRGAASPRRSPRCRCSTCTDCPAAAAADEVEAPRL